ncbi:MAG: hypothetical protein LH650_04740 [Chloroflexi bacterium]|nr:hypothetical protein [Chloroflexota bacterium]
MSSPETAAEFRGRLDDLRAADGAIPSHHEGVAVFCHLPDLGPPRPTVEWAIKSASLELGLCHAVPEEYDRLG